MFAYLFSSKANLTRKCNLHSKHIYKRKFFGLNFVIISFILENKVQWNANHPNQ